MSFVNRLGILEAMSIARKPPKEENRWTENRKGRKEPPNALNASRTKLSSQ